MALLDLAALAEAEPDVVVARIPLVDAIDYATPAAATFQPEERWPDLFRTNFASARESTAPAVDLTILRDVYVLPNGAIATPTGHVVAESCEPYHGEKRVASNFAPHVARDEEGLRALIGDAVREDGPLFHLREHGETGFFHWMHSVLPRIALARMARTGPAVRVLSDVRRAFQREGLALAGVAEAAIRPITPGETIFARELWFAGPLVRSGDFWRRPLFVPDFHRSLAQGDGTRRLYISRDDSAVRRLGNEQEVVAALGRLGFESVTLKGVPFEAQLKLFRGAQAVVGVHGAGLSHVSAMPPGGAVLEILNPRRCWPTYRAISRRAELSYGALLGEIGPEDTDNSAVAIDPDLVASAAERLLAAV